MKKKILAALTSLLAISLIFASCAKEESDGGGEVLIDREGHEIVLPEKVERIISLSPAVTQIVIDLGLEEKIVAVDVYSAAFLQPATVEKVMQFDIMQPDPEQLAILDGDIAFVTGMSLTDSQDPLAPLRDMGVAVVYVPVSNTFDEIREDILFIGSALGKKTDAQALIKEMDATLESLRVIGAKISNQKTVYFEISPPPDMYSFGTDVFLSDILVMIGAKNIFDKAGWFSVTPETIAEHDPDVILTNVDFVEDPVADIVGRAGFESLSAVKSGNVYVIDGKTSTYTNHKVVEAAKEIALAIYPEEYKEFAN